MSNTTLNDKLYATLLKWVPLYKLYLLGVIFMLMVTYYFKNYFKPADQKMFLK
jgi:hypothetical protein